MLPRLTICIPTFNRPYSIQRCLKSIETSLREFDFPVNICISDNSENDETLLVLMEFAESLKINYKKNSRNLGYAANFKSVVNMAATDYVWLIGDDDILLPNSFENIFNMFRDFPNLDFYYVNAYNLDASFFKNEWNFHKLPENMSKYSQSKPSRVLEFRELIDYKISSDFLGGMFLSIFKKKIWVSREYKVKDKDSISNKVFESLDDTFPHSKIFANSFMLSKAYFSELPMIVSVSGEREWAKHYPIIRTFRLFDLLIEYRKNGLSFSQYWRNVNYVVRYFMYDSIHYLRYRKRFYSDVNFWLYLRMAIITPNFYLSILRVIVGGFKRIMNLSKFYVRLFRNEN